MSFLDMDEGLVDLLAQVTIDKSPLTDQKTFEKECDIGLIEGGVCNDENVEVLRLFRRHCKILVSLGECAVMGGLPALRNNFSLDECLREAYLDVPTNIKTKPLVPHDDDLPKILDKVYPCHEVVKIDYFLPGCPPSAQAIRATLEALIRGEEPDLKYGLLKYD